MRNQESDVIAALCLHPDFENIGAKEVSFPRLDGITSLEKMPEGYRGMVREAEPVKTPLNETPFSLALSHCDPVQGG